MSKASEWAATSGKMIEEAGRFQPRFVDRNKNTLGCVGYDGTLSTVFRDDISPIVALAFAQWILDTFQEGHNA